MKRFIIITSLFFMYSCVCREDNYNNVPIKDTLMCKNAISPNLSDHIRRFAIVYMDIDTNDIVVVEFDNKYPFPNYLKGMIDTLAALSTKTKDNFFYGYDGGYKGCFKIKDNFVEIYDSLNIGSSFYCKGLLVDTVLYATQERDTMPKGFLILMKEYDTLSFCYFEPSC